MGYKNVMQKLTVADAIINGYSELQSLRDEMREWADNIEEKFSQTQKYADVSECADTLDNHCDDEPEVPEFASNWLIEVPQQVKTGKRSPSRQVRNDNAVQMLTAAKDELETQKDNMETNGEADGPIGELESLIDHLDNAIGDVEGINYPGMMG